MIDLKTFSLVAAASAALVGFSTAHVSAETAKAPLELAQAQSGRDTNSGIPNVPSNPRAQPNSGASGQSGRDANSGAVNVPTPNAAGSGATSMGSDQCAQISDPRSRQDCIQRQNDLRSGQPVGNNPIGSGSGVTNRGSGMH